MRIQELNTLIKSSRKVLINGERLLSHSVGVTCVRNGKGYERFIKLDMTGAPSDWIFLEEGATKKARRNGAYMVTSDDQGRSINMLFYAFRSQTVAGS